MIVKVNSVSFFNYEIDVDIDPIFAYGVWMYSGFSVDYGIIYIIYE